VVARDLDRATWYDIDEDVIMRATDAHEAAWSGQCHGIAVTGKIDRSAIAPNRLLRSGRHVLHDAIGGQHWRLRLVGAGGTRY
jgi:hypothetical protein